MKIAGNDFSPLQLTFLRFLPGGLVIVADPRTLAAGGDASGVLIVLTASIGFGLFSALGKKRVGRIGGLAQNCRRFLLGSVVELGILLAAGEPVLPRMTGHVRQSQKAAQSISSAQPFPAFSDDAPQWPIFCGSG